MMLKVKTALRRSQYRLRSQKIGHPLKIPNMRMAKAVQC